MAPDEISALASAVPGVRAAELVDLAARPGTPGSLRLTLEPGADERAVLAELEPRLASALGIAVDRPPREHPGDDLPVPLAAPSGNRLALRSIELSAAPTPRVGVLLSCRAGSRPGTPAVMNLGLADAGAGRSALQEAAAEATLRAVEQAASNRGTLRLVEVCEPVGQRGAVLAVVSMSTPSGVVELSGAALPRPRDRTLPGAEAALPAVVRAVLAALNRRMMPFVAADPHRPTEPGI